MSNAITANFSPFFYFCKLYVQPFCINYFFPFLFCIYDELQSLIFKYYTSLHYWGVPHLALVYNYFCIAKIFDQFFVNDFVSKFMIYIGLQCCSFAITEKLMESFKKYNIAIFSRFSLYRKPFPCLHRKYLLLKLENSLSPPKLMLALSSWCSTTGSRDQLGLSGLLGVALMNGSLLFSQDSS